MPAGRFVCIAFASLSVAVAPVLAGVFRGPGQYVVVSSSYVVSGSASDGHRSERYYGAIEGPFSTKAACETRVKELKTLQKTRNVLDGHALFMCNELDAPMDDDSGIWWKPQRKG